MKHSWWSWPGRFIRWLCASPFRWLPRAFGNPVPADLQVFEAQAQEATQRGLGGVAEPPAVPHPKTKPARIDPALERQ